MVPNNLATKANAETVLTPDLLELGRTIARLARQVEVALQPLEVTLAQYRVLCALALGAEASSSLAQKLAVKAPSVTTVVDGLVAAGLVDRRHDSGPDRRRVSLSLTEAGIELASKASEVVGRRLIDLVDELGDPELSTKALEGIELWGRALELGRGKRGTGPARR